MRYVVILLTAAALVGVGTAWTRFAPTAGRLAQAAYAGAGNAVPTTPTFDLDASRPITVSAVGWPNGLPGSAWNHYSVGRLRLKLPGGSVRTWDYSSLQIWRGGSFVDGFTNTICGFSILYPREPATAAQSRAAALLAQYGIAGRDSLDHWFAEQGRKSWNEDRKWRSHQRDDGPNPFDVEVAATGSNSQSDYVVFLIISTEGRPPQSSTTAAARPSGPPNLSAHPSLSAARRRAGRAAN